MEQVAFLEGHTAPAQSIALDQSGRCEAFHPAAGCGHMQIGTAAKCLQPADAWPGRVHHSHAVFILHCLWVVCFLLMYVKCSYSCTRALCGLQWVMTGIQLSAVLYSHVEQVVVCVAYSNAGYVTAHCGGKEVSKGLDEHGLLYSNLLPGNASDGLPGLTGRQAHKRRVTKSLLHHLVPAPRPCAPTSCRVLAC